MEEKQNSRNVSIVKDLNGNNIVILMILFLKVDKILVGMMLRNI